MNDNVVLVDFRPAPPEEPEAFAEAVVTIYSDGYVHIAIPTARPTSLDGWDWLHARLAEAHAALTELRLETCGETEDL